MEIDRVNKLIHQSSYSSTKLGLTLSRKFSTSSRYWARGDSLEDTNNSNPGEGKENFPSPTPPPPLVQVSEAKLAVEKAIAEFKNIHSSNSSFSSFKELANGVFQSEGTVSARIRRGGKTGFYIAPVVSLGQNYSAESLAFFVRLYFDLGQVGSISVVDTLSGNIFIRWSTESWSVILSKVTEYFSDLYGEKFIALQKLAYIFPLKGSQDDGVKLKLVELVHSLATSGNSRKLSIKELCASLNITYLPCDKDNSQEDDPFFLDNPKIPSFLFILGFLLGDGSIFIRIRLASSSGSLNFIPALYFPQKSSEGHLHMYTMISAFFKGLGINSFIINSKNGVTVLKVEGVKGVAPLVPLFASYLELGYWKVDNIKLLTEFFKYFSAGAQSYQNGLIAMLNILYKYPNKRAKSLGEWVELAEEYFNGINQGYISGNIFIQPLKGRGENIGKMIAWRVVFPEKLNLALPMKSFQFSVYGSESKALEKAIQYRDSVLDTHLKGLEEG